MLKQMQINTLIIMRNITNWPIYIFFTLLSKQLRFFFYHSETLQLEAAALKRGGTIW